MRCNNNTMFPRDCKNGQSLVREQILLITQRLKRNAREKIVLSTQRLKQ